MKKKVKVELGELNHPDTEINLPGFNVPVTQDYDPKHIIGSAKLTKEGSEVFADSDLITPEDSLDGFNFGISGRIEEVDLEKNIIKKFQITGVSLIGKLFKK